MKKQILFGALCCVVLFSSCLPILRRTNQATNVEINNTTAQIAPSREPELHSNQAMAVHALVATATLIRWCSRRRVELF